MGPVVAFLAAFGPISPKNRWANRRFRSAPSSIQAAAPGLGRVMARVDLLLPQLLLWRVVLNLCRPVKRNQLSGPGVLPVHPPALEPSSTRLSGGTTTITDAFIGRPVYAAGRAAASAAVASLQFKIIAASVALSATSLTAASYFAASPEAYSMEIASILSFCPTRSSSDVATSSAFAASSSSLNVSAILTARAQGLINFRCPG